MTVFFAHGGADGVALQLAMIGGVITALLIGLVGGALMRPKPKKRKRPTKPASDTK